MVHAIARLFDMVLPLVLLAAVRYRAPGALPATRNASGTSHARPPRVERCQRRRRRSLWLASMGIDNGPRVIHGVKVGAAR